MGRESKESKRYTKEDDEFLLNYVQQKGDNPSTWRELCKVLGVDKRYLKKKHALLTINKIWKRGPYTKEEDEIILKYVTLHGNKIETFKNLAIKLNRPYQQSIAVRYDYLLRPSPKPKSSWTVDEDKHLLEVLFRVNKRNLNFLLLCKQIIFSSINVPKISSNYM